MTADDTANRVTRATGHALNNALTAILNYADAATVAGLRTRAAAERAAAVTHRMLLLVPGRPAAPTTMDLNQAVIDAAATARLVDPACVGVLHLHPVPVPVTTTWSSLTIALLETVLPDPAAGRDVRVHEVRVHGDGTVTAGEARWQYELSPEPRSVDLPGAPVPDLLRGDGLVHVTGDQRAVELAGRVLEASGYAVDASGVEVAVAEPASSIDVLLAARRSLASALGSKR